MLMRSPQKVTVTTSKGPEGTRAEGTTVRRIEIDRLWAVVTDYERYSEFMPKTVESSVEDREGNTLVFVTALGFPMKTVRYKLRMILDRAAGTITWTLVSGDMRRNDGGWRFEDLGDGRTRITYSTLVDLGYRVPGFIAKALIGKSLPGVIETVVKRASS